MYSYKAPLEEMQFLLTDVFDAPAFWQSMSHFSDNIEIETASAILEEAAKMAEQMIFPLNRVGDETGISFTDNKVTTPLGYKHAYETFADSGWVGLCGETEFGGMGMPKMLGVLVDEMIYSASNAFALHGSLTAGAAFCIHAHGTEEIKNLYLPNLYSGRWSGAMDMTEPQAGSDLKHIQTKAQPLADGFYAISGSKIFITNGEHDLAENIIHLVLAKLPNCNGISLFLVPKYKVNADGSLGDANHVIASAVEHKMGIKASPTCVMNYDNAIGYLIGKPNRGLVCMFSMMNYERLSIGIQGLGSSQLAYQMACSYAKQRVQGHQGNKTEINNPSFPIIVHGDIRRMLLTIRTLTDAGRALAVYVGLQLDLEKHAKSDLQKQTAKAYVSLLTPVVKAFATDRGFDACVLAQQVFGGHGYIRETGIEQLVRDVRIAQIYEGTNGIQAIDFLARKVVGDNVTTLSMFFADLSKNMTSFSFVPQEQIKIMLNYFEQLLTLSNNINSKKLTQPSLLNACAVDFLNAFGYVLYGYFWLLLAEKANAANNELHIKQKLACKDFYISQILPQAIVHIKRIEAGDESIMTLNLDLF